MTTSIDKYRLAASHLEQQEAVVVLGRRYKNDHETEHDFIDCVGKELAAAKEVIKVIPEKTFVDTMYPHFETTTAPSDVKNLDRLIVIPEIAQKFRNFNVRYFIWIDGFTERTASQGSITCGIAFGGVGCFGFASWDDSANYEASIWDFKDLVLTGKVSTEAQGTSYLPAVVVPVPLLARVKANVCKSMAAQIRSFLQPEPESATR